jgi:thiol-disulfide isomerase/thioredoxin
VAGSAADWQDALGWIYFQQGKMPQAKEKLDLALKLEPNNGQTMVRLGRVYEAKGDLVGAEQLYSDAMGKPYQDEGEHPAIALLRQLYIKKHGNDTGLDAYMKPILEKGRQIRKSNVLARRIATPKPIANFSLTTLKGETVTAESLKGKVLVINFWATWCGPCRAEMPEIQKFYDKYKNDPDVAFLSMTIDDAATPNEMVQEYLTKNKFTFPVLRAHQYGTLNQINAIPDSWFVDANGNRVYEGIAGSKDLVEEFTWRVESLRAAKKDTATK